MVPHLVALAWSGHFKARGPLLQTGLVCLSMVVTGISGPAPAVTQEAEIRGALGHRLDSYVTRRAANGFSGVLLVAKKGEVVLAKGYGLADPERRIPVTRSAAFDIGSITKQFTAAAVVALEAAGKLRVDDRIDKYFERVPADKAGITIHHLLTHSSGLPAAIGDDYKPLSRDAFIERAMMSKLLSTPGETYRYSNVGYSLLAAIIEKLTATTYESYLHERILKPAGMERTGYVIPAWDRGQVAMGVREGEVWGAPHHQPWASDGPYWNLRGNGGILSTADDMYKWHLALSRDVVLSNEPRRKLFTPYIREGSAPSHYGYGWVIATTRRGTTLISHNGGNGIFAADFLRWVDEDVVLFIASNVAEHSGIRLGSTLARMLFDATYDPLNASRVHPNQLARSPQGQRAQALATVLASGLEGDHRRFVTQHIAPQLLTEIPVERFVEMLQQVYQEVGRLELRQTLAIAEHELELAVYSPREDAWLAVTIELEHEPPHRIVNIELDTDETPPTRDL